MAVYREDIVNIELSSGSIHRSFLNHTIGSGDAEANRFGVRVLRNGAAVDLSGVVCQGYFRNANGENIALTSVGAVSGNKAYVTLPQACYNVEGNFTLSIKLVGGGVTGTMRIVDGMVANTGTAGAIAPTEDIPTYEEILAVYEEMVEALDEVDNVRIGLKFVGNAVRPINQIYADDLESGYYSTTTGEKMTDGGYIRTKALYPISAGFYYSNTGDQVRACLYDETMNFIKAVYVNAKTSMAHTYIPEEAKYCGIFFASTNTTTDEVDLIRYTGAEYGAIEAPFAGKYLYIPNAWMNGIGTIAATDNMCLLGIMDVKPGDRYYVSNDATYNCLCKNKNGEMVTATPETIAPYGQALTVPAGTVALYFNLYSNVTYGGKMTNYVTKITGKKILCIGDSVTWLDGRGTYGGTSHMVGYQGVLRKAGHEVHSAGFSGYPYTAGCHEQETAQVKYSIYNEIVNKEYDVDDFDIVILAGGLNDMLYSAPIGDRPDDYSSRTFDSETFNGAIGGIISYIRENNPSAKIVICTTTKSEALTRVWTRASAYNAEIEYNSTFWSAKLCNLFRDVNVQPTYDNFDMYFYDSTHPNNDGMELIGNQMLNAIEGY